MDKTVLITGAFGGIGQSLCKFFQRNQWKVVGIDVKCPKEGGIPHCDVSFDLDLKTFSNDTEYRQSWTQQLKAAAPTLNGLVNNAAVQLLDSFDSVRLEDWNETLSVNVTGPMLLSQALLPELEKANGSIVNISSIHERLTKPAFISYATSKSALVGLTQAMAVDLSGRVRVNCISPAAVETPMLKEGFVNNPEGYIKLNEYHPVGRIGTPLEVAELAYFLIAGEAKFITGSNFQIDGGISKRLHDPD